MKETPETVIQQLTVQDQVLFEWVKNLQITDDDSKRNAENLQIGAKTAYKRAEGKQKELLEPIKEADSRIRDLFRPYLTRLKECIGKLEQGLGAYHAEEIRLAREEQELIMAEQAAKLAEAELSGEVVDLPTVEVQAPAKTSRPGMGSMGYRDDLDIQIVQPDLVPRDLCEPSMSKIRARAKSGVKDIPGVLITGKYTTVAKAG